MRKIYRTLIFISLLVTLCCSEDILIEIIKIDEIEAPSNVSSTVESFDIYLISDHDVACYSEADGSDIGNDAKIEFDIIKKTKVQIEMQVQGIIPKDGLCRLWILDFGRRRYTIAGPFQVGDFRIIVHQPDDSTIEETVEIVE